MNIPQDRMHAGRSLQAPAQGVAAPGPRPELTRQRQLWLQPNGSPQHHRHLNITQCLGQAGTATTTTTTTTSPNTFTSTSTSAAIPPAPPAGPTLKQRTYDLCLALGITQHTAFRLAASHPDTSIQQLSLQTSSLARSLTIPLEDLCLLASKEPLLLGDPVQLGQTMVILRDLLGGLTPTDLSQAIIRTPSLLTMEPEVLLEQFDQLQDELEVDKDLLSQLVRMQPYMLNTPVAKISSRVSQLASVLRVSGPQAVQLLAAYPPLAVEEASKLRGRLDDLCVLLNADVQQVLDMVGMFPPILITHPDITAARLQLLADNLDVPPTCIMPLVLRSPSLFGTPQNILVAQFSKLFEYFGHSHSKVQVLELIAANPGLLGLGPALDPAGRATSV